MYRPRAYAFAAVLMFLFSLVAATLHLPNVLNSGATLGVDGPFEQVSLVGFSAAALGIVSAYAVWMLKRWGVALAIALCVVQTIIGLGGVIFAPTVELRVLSGLGVAWAAVIIVLLLRAGLRKVAA